jgi:AcrR family transcriptional regulator
LSSTARRSRSGLSDRQQEILGAASDLLVAGGTGAITMGRIAERVGIKPPSLYKHFPDKRALEVLLIADTLAGLAETLEAAGPELDDIASAYRASRLENPQLYRLMTERPLPRDELPEGLEARAAAPILAALGDPDLARAAWVFAHGDGRPRARVALPRRCGPRRRVEQGDRRLLDSGEFVRRVDTSRRARPGSGWSVVGPGER